MSIPYFLNSWWSHQMETFSALLAICAGNSPVPGEFPTQRPVTRSFDAFFDLRLNKRLSKQWWGWWFETLSRLLWRHRNVYQISRILDSIFLTFPTNWEHRGWFNIKINIVLPVLEFPLVSWPSYLHNGNVLIFDQPTGCSDTPVLNLPEWHDNTIFRQSKGLRSLLTLCCASFVARYWGSFHWRFFFIPI